MRGGGEVCKRSGRRYRVHKALCLHPEPIYSPVIKELQNSWPFQCWLTSERQVLSLLHHRKWHTGGFASTRQLVSFTWQEIGRWFYTTITRQLLSLQLDLAEIHVVFRWQGNWFLITWRRICRLFSVTITRQMVSWLPDRRETCDFSISEQLVSLFTWLKMGRLFSVIVTRQLVTLKSGKRETRGFSVTMQMVTFLPPKRYAGVSLLPDRREVQYVVPVTWQQRD